MVGQLTMKEYVVPKQLLTGATGVNRKPYADGWETIPLASRPLNDAQTIQFIEASTAGRLRRVIDAYIQAQGQLAVPVARDAIAWD